MWGEDWGTMIWGSAVQVPTLGPIGWTLLTGALVGVALLLYRRPRSKAKATVALAMLAIAPAIFAAIALSISGTALADQVGALVTFTNGTVADADEVNANFDAVKTAVDDNDSRATTLEGQVTTLEADKQERVTGSCPAGESIRVVNANGTVICEVDDDIDTNAATLCGNGAFLNGDGTCDPGFLDADGVDADTNTNAATLCGNGAFLNGDGTCDPGFLDVDGVDADTNTNAATICANGAFLNGDGSCDTADGSGTCTAGRVCAGGHTHPGGEITSGTIDIGSGSYTHSTRTGYFHVNGVELIPQLGGYNFTTSSNGYIRPSGASTSFFGNAPVDLPQGATITAVTIYAYDNSSDATPQTWLCAVRRRPLGSTAGTGVIERNLSINWAPSTSIRTSSTGGGTHVVDKVNNAYWLRAGISNADGSANFRFFGCRITYTYSNTNH